MMKHPSGEKCCKGSVDAGLLVMRIIAGGIFIMAGYAKLFTDTPGIEGFSHMIAGMGFPAATFFAYLVALIEFFGGIGIVFGIGTRLFAPLLAIVMVVAFFGIKAKMPGGALVAGQIDLTLFAIMFLLVMSGPGKFAFIKGCCRKSREIMKDNTLPPSTSNEQSL